MHEFLSYTRCALSLEKLVKLSLNISVVCSDTEAIRQGLPELKGIKNSMQNNCEGIVMRI